MTDPKYIVGIDLGTTNSVVAYTEIELEKGKEPEILTFHIPQLVDAGVVEKRESLPSFILIPTAHDVSPDALSLPWDENNKIAVGEFARNRGAELPARLISSSKSWLCNTMVDRNEKILPWELKEEIAKLSPVEASSEILKIIKDAWNAEMASADESLILENQDILLTVPASFDAVARELTVKAAEFAGLTNITLLEEPQAAFYAWIESKKEDWRKIVTEGDLILICDVGGGTTDFSLIQVSEEDGELTLERIAVGNHLLVGGDNMDLALAYSVSNRMAKKKKKLDAWQMRGLWQSCRNAKETLLNNSDQESFPLTVLGRGSSLIGGTIKTELTRDEVDQVILSGFFPACGKDAQPKKITRMGIQEFGLSYESDPAITHHLAQFLRCGDQTDKDMKIPTAVFFNGGVMKSTPVRQRIMGVISDWTPEKDQSRLREIEADNFDLAVARGAAYYGIARRGTGIRIRGGLGKSYYMGVAAALPAVPGMPIPMKAICVGPFGMEEGTTATLDDQEFVLIVGEPVVFDFLGSVVRFEDQVGTILDEWEDELEKITTIEATLDGSHGTTIPVTIEIKVTEIGTLELWCVSRNDDKKWKLEFNTRETERFEH